MNDARLDLGCRRRQWLMGCGVLGLAACLPVWGQRPGVLRVGFIANYEPFSFMTPDRGLTGFDVEVVQALAASMGWRVQAETTRFEPLRERLRSGQLDLLGNQLLMLPEHRAVFDFVRPYATVQLVSVQHEDDERDFLSLEDLLGRRLGVLRDTGVAEQARSVLGAGAVSFDRIEQALQALQSRQLDAVLEENLIAEYHIERAGLPLRLGAPMAASYKLGLAVPKGRQTLQKTLSEAVALLVQQPVFREISRRWFGHDVSRPRVSHVSAMVD